MLTAALIAVVFCLLEGWYGKSVEQIRLRRRPGLRQDHRFIQNSLLIQMNEYLVDDHRIFDTGDHPDSTATLGAGFYIDIEHPLQSLSPCH